MINPFFLSPKNRLEDWKIMRNSLSSHTEYEQLEIVEKYWAQAPIKKFSYDPENPKSWSTTPWDMIYEGNWCQFSTAIGMEFTLRLAGWNPERLTLYYIKNIEEHTLSFVLDIDNQYWLNYEYGTVHVSRNINNFIVINIVKYKNNSYQNI